MRVGRSSVADGVLTTHLNVPGSGKAGQQVKIRTARGPVRVCSAHEQATEAGSLTLRCSLSAFARRHLSIRWLRLDVETTFTPWGGSGEALAYAIIARRD
jgi:hypothetical protein